MSCDNLKCPSSAPGCQSFQTLSSALSHETVSSLRQAAKRARTNESVRAHPHPHVSISSVTQSRIWPLPESKVCLGSCPPDPSCCVGGGSKTSFHMLANTSLISALKTCKDSPEVESEYAFVRRHHQDFLDEATHYQTLLNEQSQIFHQMLDANTSAHPNHASVFIEGRPGRGKTFAVRALASTLRSMDRIVLIVGSSAFVQKHTNVAVLHTTCLESP